MTDMEFTPDQEKAIRHEGENILVSAGAGSGKTAVLTARVLAKLRRGISVDRLVILTFTNAAAAEMRARIKAKITADPLLSHQLKRLDNAVISTFDSYALRLVRQYHYLLGIGEDVRIVDSGVLRQTESAVLDAVLRDRYSRKEPRFISTVDRLYDKGDSAYRDAVLTLIRATEAVPDRDAFFRNYETRFFGPETLDSAMKGFRSRLARQTVQLSRILREFRESLAGCPDGKITVHVSAVSERLSPLFGCDDADGLLTLIPEVRLPSSPRLSPETQEIWGETFRQGYDRLRDLLKEIQGDLGKLYIRDMEEARDAVLETKETVLEIVDASSEFLRRLQAEKKSRNLHDFADVMNLAIGLLEDHPEVAGLLREQTAEILVDEYQDTNDLQDHFLSLIERDNLFLVGDVKQSIYGFRNANPRNFSGKYHEYDERGTGKTIDLRANFRSREEVLDAVNLIFADLMDDRLGGTDYRKRQALVCGNAEYARKRTSGDDYRPEILEYPGKDEGKPARSRAWTEGAVIAADIRSRMETGFSVMDASAGTLRPASYRDFAVLVDRKSGFEEMRKALVDAGIPVLAFTDEKFLASSEILFVNDALRLVRAFGNPVEFAGDLASSFYGVARSFVFGYPDEAIVRILLETRGTPERIPERLRTDPVFSPLASIFTRLAARVDSLPPEDTLLDLYVETRSFLRLSGLEDPENVERKLLFLLEKAAELPDFTLGDLIAYFEDLYREKDLDIEFSRPFDPSLDAVRLMTLHKSKGLEFPICYFPGLSKRFNQPETKAFFRYDPRFGLIAKAMDGGFKDTVLHRLAGEETRRQTVSERIRLFYVGLTRAREKIIFVREEGSGRVSPEIRDAKGYLDESVRLRFASFADFLAAVPGVSSWTRPAPFPVPGSLPRPRTPIPALAPIRHEEIVLRPIPLATRTFSKAPPSLRNAAEKEAMDRGTRFHDEMSRFDFRGPEASLSRLSPSLREPVLRLLESEPLRNPSEAVFHPEYEFREETGEGVASGIIDLLIERPGSIDILDYKLKRLDDDAYARQLSGYRDFIRRLTGKPVRTWLVSLTDGTIHLLEE